MSRLILLMAGGSKAFEEAGHLYPKNLTEIHGRPLLQHVLDGVQSLPARLRQRIVCAVAAQEDARFHTSEVIRLVEPRAQIVSVAGNTGGAACTALLAIEHINPEEPLIVMNGDIVIDASLDTIIEDFEARELDAGAVVFNGVHPRWSFLRLGEDGLAVEAAEKRPISHHATTGLYYYRKGRFFTDAVFTMLKKDAHVDGVFYICPAFNEMILAGQKVGIHTIDKASYHTLKSPADVQSYERHLAQIPDPRMAFG